MLLNLWEAPSSNLRFKIGAVHGGIVAAGGVLTSFFGPFLPVQNPFSPAFLALGGLTVYYLADIAEKLEPCHEDDNQ